MKPIKTGSKLTSHKIEEHCKIEKDGTLYLDNAEYLGLKYKKVKEYIQDYIIKNKPNNSILLYRL